MFDVSWSELLILGVVALIFVGPKELPRFLNTLGRYAGVVKRQANEFRAVFDQAMREAEMDQIQKEMRSLGDGVKSSLDGATRSVESAKTAANVDLPSEPAKVAASAASPPEIEAGRASQPAAKEDEAPREGAAVSGVSRPGDNTTGPV